MTPKSSIRVGDVSSSELMKPSSPPTSEEDDDSDAAVVTPAESIPDLTVKKTVRWAVEVFQTLDDGRGRRNQEAVDDGFIYGLAKPKESKKKAGFIPSLMEALSDESLSDILTWLPHGRAFVILQPDLFSEHVVPRCIPSYKKCEDSGHVDGHDDDNGTNDRNIRRYRGFLKKLMRCGFQQVTSGPDDGAFCNPLFLRDEPDLCHQIPSSKPPRIKPPKKSPPSTYSPSIPCSDGDLQETSESTTTTDEEKGTTLIKDEVFTYKTNDAVVACIRDQSVVSDALRRRDEEELVRAARSMLYANYLQALASSPPTFE